MEVVMDPEERERRRKKRKEIGARLKALRIQSGKKAKVIAEELHVDPSLLSQWERGISLPSTSSLSQLASIYNVTIDYILDGSPKVSVSALAEDDEIKKFVLSKANLVDLKGLEINIANSRYAMITSDPVRKNDLGYIRFKDGGVVIGRVFYIEDQVCITNLQETLLVSFHRIKDMYKVVGFLL
jgi:transcriptional regulator with XRE-family HTH domain